MEPLFGQHLIIGIQGHHFKSRKKKSFLWKRICGGVVLFGRNCESIQQLWNLCEEIQSLSDSRPSSKLPFFIGPSIWKEDEFIAFPPHPLLFGHALQEARRVGFASDGLSVCPEYGTRTKGFRN